MGSVTIEQLIAFFAVCGVILGAYNTIMSARKHHNEAKNERENPFVKLKEKVDDHESRISDLQHDSTDIKEGQKAMVFGLQTLLEHELHNGNADQMEKAANSLNKWLIGRK